MANSTTVIRLRPERRMGAGVRRARRVGELRGMVGNEMVVGEEMGNARGTGYARQTVVGKMGRIGTKPYGESNQPW